MMLFTGTDSRPIKYGTTAEATIAGAEFNLAVNLSRLGHSVRWLSAVGDDVFGRDILKIARSENIDVSEVLTLTSGPTGVMFKSPRTWGEPEVMYYRASSACSQMTPDDIPANAWQGAKHMFVTGITPALSASCAELTFYLVQTAKAAGITIWLDPNYRRKLWSEAEFRTTMTRLLPLVDYVLPGRGEGEIITGETTLEAMAAWILNHGPKAVIIKDGLNGAYWYTAEESYFAAPVEIENIVNPIGAGDAFAAGLISGALDGLEPISAMNRAHALGALACCCSGDWEGAPTRAELTLFMSQNREAIR